MCGPCSGVRSCGCLRIELQKNRPPRIKHGKWKTRGYHIWQHMKARCSNPNRSYYHRYGGRGIKVCDRWLNSFENFYKDMGDCPSSKHTIDRIDNDQGYFKENCKWATRKEQCRNRTNTVIIDYKNQKKSLMDWLEELKLVDKYDSYSSRDLDINIKRKIESIYRYRYESGWDAEKIFTTPINPKKI